jgi:hypothetical protein
MLDLILAAALHTTVHFHFVDNRIMVTTTIDGGGPFTMIVDTGSQGLLITPQTARALGLAPNRPTIVTGAGAGTATAGRVRVRHIGIGTYGAGPVDALVVNLDRIRNAFHFPRLDGVIGYDMLAGRYVGFDMTGQRLTISNLDIGDRSSLTLFEPFARANGFYSLRLSDRNVPTGIGIGGVIRGNVFTSTLDALGFTAYDVPTRAPLGPSGAFDSTAHIGSIGDGLLRRYNLVFDGVARTIAAWPADLPPAANATMHDAALPRHATLGAVLGRSDGRGAPITSVVPGGPAARAGLASGDVVVALGATSIYDTSDVLWTLHQLAGGTQTTISFIRNGAPQRVAIDLGGIGCYSVDVAANPQDPYLNLAHDVSRAGFVTMRVEKSGVGDSGGPPCHTVDFDAELRSYRIALQTLLHDPQVDTSKVYIFGHSIGSLEGPLLAGEFPVKGLIVAEGIGRDWPEYELRNLRRQLELSGDDSAAVDRALMEKAQCMERLLYEHQPETRIEQAIPSCRIHNGVYPVDAPYVQQAAQIDIIGQWMKLNVPVLTIWGASDFVAEEADQQRIAEVVNTQHPGTATFEQIPNMDHLLGVQPTQRAALDAFSAGAAERYNADLSTIIIAWLRSLDSR